MTSASGRAETAEACVQAMVDDGAILFQREGIQLRCPETVLETSMNSETTASEFLRAQRAKVPAETYKEHLVSLDKNKSDSQF